MPAGLKSGVQTMPSLATCFATYGAKPKNKRWSWSARSDTEVVVTLWFDGIRRDWTYNSNPHGHPLALDSPAKKERLENLIWARDNAEGRFRVVIAVAEDVHAEPRAIRDCYPRPDVVMQLTWIDEETGEFIAERVT